jgi:agmatinase
MHDLKEFRNSRIPFITSEEIHQDLYMQKIHNTIAQLRTTHRCYLSIDLDILGFSDAPGVCVYEPGGISYYQLREIIEYLTSCCQIIGMDIVEYDPLRDINEITGTTASKIILDTLGSAFYEKNKK